MVPPPETVQEFSLCRTFSAWQTRLASSLLPVSSLQHPRCRTLPTLPLILQQKGQPVLARGQSAVQPHPFALQAAQQVSSAGPCSATILSGLESHWKLRGHSPRPLAKHRSAPTATWTSLFSFPNPLHYNNLLTYLSVTLLWAKDNSFPSPKSSALIQVLNLNSSDPHL